MVEMTGTNNLLLEMDQLQTLFGEWMLSRNRDQICLVVMLGVGIY